MKILIVEDDYTYFADLKLDLEGDREFARRGLKVILVESEREFGEKFEDIAEAQYDFAIIDVMVKWEGRETNRKRPDEEVLKGGYYRAGFRCLKKLRADPRTSSLRVVVHSNLDEQHMGELASQLNKYTRFIPKSGSSEDLFKVLRSWMAAPAIQGSKT
jgi:CheY-like chemotaxis protein